MKEYTKENNKEWLRITIVLITLGIISTIMAINLTSAQFISPTNQTYNHSNITLNYELNETPSDFYYIINNNTDGTERLYPDNYSVEFEAVEGENIVIAFYIINFTEFNESITFYVNTTIVNETEVIIITTPVIIPDSSSSGSGGGTCMTKWNCSEWSECQSSGTQSRVCSYKTNYCKPTSVKPNETQSCNYIKPAEVEPEEAKNETKETTDNVNKEGISINRATWAIIVIVIIVILFIIIYNFGFIFWHLEEK